MLVLLGVLRLTGEQLAGIELAAAAVLMAIAAWMDPRVPFGSAGK